MTGMTEFVVKLDRLQIQLWLNMPVRAKKEEKQEDDGKLLRQVYDVVPCTDLSYQSCQMQMQVSTHRLAYKLYRHQSQVEHKTKA